MVAYGKPFNINTFKRFPLLFCIDISANMSQSDCECPPIELTNILVANIISDIFTQPKLKHSVEVAFVLFSDRVDRVVDFQPVHQIGNIEEPCSTVDRSNIANAVSESIKLIEKRRQKLEDSEMGYYPPRLVLISSGQTGDDYCKSSKGSINALNLLDMHTSASQELHDLIVPIVIGVGNKIQIEELLCYARSFSSNIFEVADLKIATNLDIVKLLLFEFEGHHLDWHRFHYDKYIIVQKYIQDLHDRIMTLNDVSTDDVTRLPTIIQKDLKGLCLTLKNRSSCFCLEASHAEETHITASDIRPTTTTPEILRAIESDMNDLLKALSETSDNVD